MSRSPAIPAALALVAVLSACAVSPGAGTTPARTSEGSASAVATSGPSASAPPSGQPTPPSAGASAEASATAAPSGDALLAASLTDVRSGETFTLAELAADGPVVIETMAIWCSNCRSQMREVTAAHELAEFHSVSIDVEPSEAPEDLADYAAREGFDWPFVLADAQLATQLRERFGTEVLFPPGMPKLLVREDGSIELLPLGELLTAAEIAALVEG